MLSVCMFGMYSYFVLYIVFRCDLVCQLIAFKKICSVNKHCLYTLCECNMRVIENDTVIYTMRI
ncbi:hypothetical protein BMR56_11290 [Escherichia coli]|nr:hypothetical protein BMR56_11290 [Escherichia coli]PPX10062.1 hypothetical protein C5P24_09685 [Escherichia coli]TGD21017.1 hypothetical protein DXT71_26640 [Escherichia coli]